ncbi:MAG: ThuA domain-containing protein [Gammaproteobacteria bacterium]|nr:ThuA domain-containing protein [Gammaproteobacteria bacterium]
MNDSTRVHVVVGGFPVGKHAGHDMDYARFKLLAGLQEHPQVHATVSGDFTDCQKWIGDCQFLITYVAGPYADDEQAAMLEDWLARGGRWLALHGTCGGKAVRTGRPDNRRRWVRARHHDVLGSFFLTHPPIMAMNVNVEVPDHPLTRGLPASFEMRDEPYMVELTDPAHSTVLLTTQDIDAPGYVQEIYGADSSLLPDGRSRALGYVREVGEGAVAYFSFGHCHTPSTNVQRTVHASIATDNVPPLTFKGVWETSVFEQLMRNALAWGLLER